MEELKIGKLYKSSEVAKMLNITPATLKNHFKKGLIEAVTINSHRYYTAEAIMTYIENGKKTSEITIGR